MTRDVPFIEWIGYACLAGGLVAMIGGVVLAVVESRTNDRVTRSMDKLGTIAQELAKKKDEQPATSIADALSGTANAFSEFVRASRSPAKSVPAFRTSLVLFLLAGGLAVVDRSVAPRNNPSSTSTSSSITSSTTTTSTTTTSAPPLTTR